MRNALRVLALASALVLTSLAPGRAQDQRDTRDTRIALYASLACGDLEAFTRAVKTLKDRVRDPGEAAALRVLFESLNAQSSAHERRRLATARVSGELDVLRRFLRKRRPGHAQLSLWLRAELALALDADGINLRDRKRARSALRAFLAHPTTRAGKLSQDLREVLQASAETRRVLGLARDRRRMGEPARAEFSSVSEIARRILMRIDAGVATKWRLVETRVVTRRMRMRRAERKRCSARIQELERRIRRLRAQIPDLTDPERRDAQRNRAVIERDIAKNERAIRACKARIRSLDREIAALASVLRSARDATRTRDIDKKF